MKNSQDYCGVTRNCFTEWGNALENTGKVLHLQRIVLAESSAQAAPGSEGCAEESGTHIRGNQLQMLFSSSSVDESGGATGKGWENPMEVRK